jgi:DNA-binding NarL/FixJ family response regulator
MQQIRVALADDDATMRSTLAATLRTDERYEVVAVAESGTELLELVRTLRPHVALVDLRMPGGGVELLEALHDGPPVVALVVSAESAPSAVVSVLRAGARGYLAKGRIGHCLPDFVWRSAHGEVVLAVPTGAEVLRQLLSVPVV